MPEIIPEHVPSPRTLLAWDGTAYRPVSIDAAGQLQIDVLSSVMDPLAATAAAQALALAQLQLIEDLRGALQSVATDRLQVRGEDQLFSYDRALFIYNTGVLAAVDGSFDSTPVPAGEIWEIANAVAVDRDTATTQQSYFARHELVSNIYDEFVAAIPAGVRTVSHARVWLGPEDFIRVTFVGGLVNDRIQLTLTGYRMTLEA